MEQWLALVSRNNLLKPKQALHRCVAQNTQSQLRVGAAKLNVTPKLEELPKNSLGIHDSIYIRAIVIDNGNKAALVTVAGNQNEQSWKASTERMEKEPGNSAKNVVILSTHSHSVGRITAQDERYLRR